jgi:Zn-dependent M28 family amino/carboxypeptidase
MTSKNHRIELYPPPNKTTTPTISPSFSKNRQLMMKEISINSSIASQVALVAPINIQTWVDELTGFHNRHSKSKYINQVAEWIKNELLKLGYGNGVHFHDYTESGYQLKNVICDKRGTSQKYIIICAHYDTILKENLDDSVSRAPGADDNASGVVALLEIARIISSLNLEKNVQFAFFSGEEQGLWGSMHYAQQIKENNTDLHLLINMDMCGETGFLSSSKTANVDVDDGQTGVVTTNNQTSQSFGLTMEQMAKNYTDLDIEFDPIYASDYMPFEARGYVCIGAYDGSAETSNPHYHSSTDTPGNLNINFLVSVTKMVLATLLYEGKII